MISILRQKVLLAVALLFATGCANHQEMLARSQAMAMQTAVDRGQFEMNCSSATAAIISRDVLKPVKPVLQGPLANGFPGAKYTIGVEGCNKHNTYVVTCPQGGNGCFIPGWVSFTGQQ
jgi:hypothetical protein